MSERLASQQSSWLRPKVTVFAAVGAMTLYVLYHNERFLIEPQNPIWRHYAEIAFWLVPHAVAGTCALVNLYDCPPESITTCMLRTAFGAARVNHGFSPAPSMAARARAVRWSELTRAGIRAARN